MLATIRKALGFDDRTPRPAGREGEKSEQKIVPGPPIASSGALLDNASKPEKSETEAALEKAAGKND